QLEKMVCVIEGQCMPLSKMINGVWTIIGKGTIVMNDSTLPVNDHTATKFEDYTFSTPTYTKMLDIAITAHEQCKNNNIELQIQIPHLVKDGGAKLIWTNFAETCKSLNREPTMIMTFFMEELCNKAMALNPENQLIIRG